MRHWAQRFLWRAVPSLLSGVVDCTALLESLDLEVVALIRDVLVCCV
jgi:hypothetical protein